MKNDWSPIEQYRWQEGPLGRSPISAHYGAFIIRKGGTRYSIIACDAEETGWEHVSVTVSYRIGNKWKNRMPTWEEMSSLKALFWDEEECVVQFHPPKSEYVNNHSTCLHLWKCTTSEFPLPPSELVGIKTQ